MRPTARHLAMTAAELRFRSVAAGRDAIDAIRFACGRERWRRDRLGSQLHAGTTELLAARRALAGRDWPGAHAALRSHFRRRAPRFLIAPANRDVLSRTIRDEFPSALEDAVGRADRVVAGRYDLLGYHDLSFRAGGHAIDWQRDPVHGRRPPLRFWRRVSYLDPRFGDHKIIWELNRHQHWLRLGRAAWLSGNARYARAFVRELEGWMSANPPLAGVNWASMLELALRSISWIWALHLFAAFDDEDGATWLVDVLIGLDRQLDHVLHHLSVYFSPNTHLLGEGLALYVAGRALPELRAAAQWDEVGRGVLLCQATAQVNPDGGHAELSTHYHRYALDFYLFALAVARTTGDAAAPRFAEVAGRMASFCRALADDDGRLPAIGDDDGGLLFPICGRTPSDASDSLSLAAALLERPELAVGDPPEEVFWILADRAALAHPDVPVPQRSRAFLDSGYLVVRPAGAHAVLDAGPHGFLNGGHAHADALSLVLSVHGRPLLIDPGTATYTMDPALRDRFRSTPMHNTAVVDGRSQSEPAGPFHWRSRAGARVDLWQPGGAIQYVEASHDGYAPVVHRRAVVCDGPALWLVADHLIGEGTHRIDVYWHLDPAWQLAADPASTVVGRSVVHPAGVWAAIASTAPDVRAFHGDTEGLGWSAPVYGRLVPSVALRFTQAGRTPRSIVTAIAAGPVSGSALPRLSIDLVPVAADADDGWQRIAARVQHGANILVAGFAAPSQGSAAKRSAHRVRCGASELTTDARVALLRLSPEGEPETLSLVDGRLALWNGPAPFAINLPEPAADLHFDLRAQRGLSSSARPVPANDGRP